ncbi:MAG: class I SAM-dependent methyltransferase [Methylococcales bacterium]|nr:class I SAM-dependent methyltransferase [Methylococcales bacterium]
MTNKTIQAQLVAEMEYNLERHGDNYRGVGWTKSQENADLRYKVMLELIPENQPCTLLDIGCGAAHLYEYMLSRHIQGISYSGLDLSPAYLALCRRKHPQIEFFHADILDEQSLIPSHDYVLMNGVFNYKGDHSIEQMWDYCRQMLLKANTIATKGFAFNVVSKYVDWERDDLFHLSFDQLAAFLDEKISRNFIFRHDYGLFEYTIYVYKK